MLPTSLPGAIPAGITAARPTSARAASRARVGMDATSSGVLPSRAATGRSAQPSGTHTTYFTASVWQALCAPRHEYRQTRTMATEANRVVLTDPEGNEVCVEPR